jgi:hypothetical protein
MLSKAKGLQLTFWDGLAKSTVPVQNNLLVLGLDQVVDDMRCRGVSSGVAEPLVAGKALDMSANINESRLPTAILTLTTHCGL